MDPCRRWRRFALSMSFTLASIAILLVAVTVAATVYEAIQTQVAITSGR